MSLVINVLLIVLIVACLVAALLFVLQAVQARTSTPRQPYTFGKTEARKQASLGYLKAVVALIAMVIFAGIFAVRQLTVEPEVVDDGVVLPISTPDNPDDTAPTAAPTEAVATVSSTETPAPTSPLPTVPPTETPTVTPLPTATSLPTALVNSPNGLFLREQPAGTQEVELIPDGTVLTLLGEEAEANDLLWVQVRTPNGNIGWVALDFLTLPNTP